MTYINKVMTKKIFVLKTYLSYKNSNAQNTGNKTARLFLQYKVQMVP